MSEDFQRFRRLLEIQRRLAGERDLSVLPRLVMQETVELLTADRGTLFLFDWDTMELRARFATGMENAALVVPLRMGIIGSAVLTRVTLNVTNAYAHPYFNPEIDALSGYKTDSLLAVPMQTTDGRVLGGIELLNKATGRFVPSDEHLAEAVARSLSKLIEARQLTKADAGREMAALTKSVGCERGTVFILDESDGRLHEMHAEGSADNHIILNLKLGIAGLVAVTKKTLLIPDAAADVRFDGSFDRRSGYRTRGILCVPLVSPSGEALGVIQVINKKAGPFDEDDASTLESIAGIVAIAVENAMLLRDHDRQFHSLLEALAASIDAKDALTAGHSKRVAEIAMAIAHDLGFAEADLDVLRVAAILHDYGKIGVEDCVLKKKGRLEEDEYRHMKTHAAITYDILEKIHFARKYGNVPLIASSHHEYLDGSGYPRGLSAGGIPFMSKILTVADVFEALTANRHYRKGMSVPEALKVLDEGRGVKFDAHVVAALKRYLKNIGERCGDPVYSDSATVCSAEISSGTA